MLAYHFTMSEKVNSEELTAAAARQQHAEAGLLQQPGRLGQEAVRPAGVGESSPSALPETDPTELRARIAVLRELLRP